jgi:hypothetical protein
MTEKPGENESTLEPLESTNTAVGEPVAMAILTLLTPAVMGKERDDEPMESLRVYLPTENTTT